MSLHPKIETASRFLKTIELQPSEIETLTCDASVGLAVKGRFVIEGGIGTASLRKQHLSLYNNPKRERPPATLSKAEQDLWDIDFWNSPAGWEALEKSKQYSLELEPDGTFHGRNIEPGVYNLAAHLYLQEDGTNRKIRLTQPQHSRDLRIEMPRQGQIVELGQFTIERLSNE